MNYMNSMDKFDEIELPSIDKLYSKLQKKHISDKYYAHAKKCMECLEYGNAK